jgi:RHS repeat-associated protein
VRLGRGASCCFIDRLQIHLTDGSTHEFRSSDRPYCYGIDDTTTLPDDLYSVDGTRMRYKRSLKRLYLPDGSYWNLANGATPAQYFDRNGNRLLSDGEDSLGRTFTSPLANTATDYTYTVPGVGGVPLTYTLRWRNLDQVLTEPLAPSQSLPNYSDDCVASGCTAPFLFVSDTGASTPVRVVGGSDHLNQLVLYQIVLPHDPSDQSPPTYTFTYNVYLEIDKVVYPTGGYERFRHGLVEPQQNGTFVYAEGNRGVTDRWVSAKGDGSDEAHWQYAWTDAQGQLRRGEITPDGTRTERLSYGTTVGATYWSYADARAGRPAEERVYNAAGQMVRRTLMEWTNSGSNYTPTGAFNAGTATRNPRLTKEVEIILDTGGAALAKTTVHNYDSTYEFTVGDVETSVTEYDYVTLDQSTAQAVPLSVSSISSGAPLRTQETVNVLNDPTLPQATRDAYRARNLVSLPSVARVRQGGPTGQVISETRLTYDQYDAAHYPLITYGVVKNWGDPQTGYRGNVTTTASWLNTTGAFIETHARYDQCGNTRYSWDANGNQSQVDYTDSFSDGIAHNTYAYQTSSTTPAPDATGAQGSGSGLVTSTKYDFSTGLVRSDTDANNQTTTLDYSDPLNRLKTVTRPTGGGSTSYEYGDSINNLYVRTRVALDDLRSTDAYQYFDGLGRPSRSYAYDGSAADRTWVAVKTTYDDLDRTASVSNPQFRVDLEDFTPASVTTSEYDYLGRTKKVTTPDGAYVTTSYDADLTTSPGGMRVTVTDQAGKTKSSVSDALGSLVKVTEAPGVADYGYETTYKYDLLGNLTNVTQGKAGQTQQTRAFVYDSLSRLKSAENPESGKVTYEYDTAGNLKKKADARHVQIDYTYDALSRVTKRSYSIEQGHTAPADYAGAFDVNYFYDGTGMPSEGGAQLPTPANSAGLLTAVKSSVSETVYTEFDAAGRVKKHRQISDPGAASEHTYTLEYSYDLAGNLTSEKYPSGKTVVTEYDGAGRVAGVRNQTTGAYYAGGAASDSAGRIRYAPHGAPEAVRLGNGLWEHTTFNSRFQVKQIGLGASADDSGKLLLTYGYGPAAQNNGNVRSQRIEADGLDLTQTYAYDPVNRLLSAREAATAGGADTWRQAYTYADSTGQNTQFGNRRVDTSTDPATGLPRTTANATPQFNPQINSANNRFGDNQGYAYDDAGNLSQDPPHTYSYDGENRMVALDGGWNGASGAGFYYDGDGHRVKKASALETTTFVYDAAGRVVAEYSNQVEYKGTRYLTQDPLGSARVVTDAQGNAHSNNGADGSRHDYLPFGEELGVGVGGRTAVQGYGVADDMRRKFTSKQRDAETGLDYFEARYYSSVTGRFTSPDEFAGGPDEYYDFHDLAAANPTFYADLTDPQSLNKYVYCYNNPLLYVDPDGHQGIREYARQAAEAVADTAKGVAKGIASSVSFSRYGAPSSDDSIPDRIGQGIGTVLVGATGTGGIEGGIGMTVVSGGTALATGVPEVAILGGATLAAGAARNVAAIVTTPIRHHNTSEEPQPVTKKEAVREAHKEVGKQTERGTGKFGSPMRGNSKKGYRLDPPNPNGKGLEKTNRHINWWDYTKGKRGSGGRKGYIPIKNPGEN